MASSWPRQTAKRGKRRTPRGACREDATAREGGHVHEGANKRGSESIKGVKGVDGANNSSWGSESEDGTPSPQCAKRVQKV